MSLADQVTNLTNDRNNIRTALVNKGITEAASHGFSSFDDDIDAMVKPEGTITVTENGEYDVTEREGIIVDVYTVNPLDAPDVFAESQLYAPVLYVIIHESENAICYTLQKKVGLNGEWETLRTMITFTDIYMYPDYDVSSGETYYYRAFAISDGDEYGNSLSSEIAHGTPNQYADEDVVYFEPDNYCEEVTGGWIVEAYNRGSTPSRGIPEPYTPEFDDDGYIGVSVNYTNVNNAFIRTVNPINIRYGAANKNGYVLDKIIVYWSGNISSSYTSRSGSNAGIFPVDTSGTPSYTRVSMFGSGNTEIDAVSMRNNIGDGGAYYVGMQVALTGVVANPSTVDLKITSVITKWVKWDGILYSSRLEDSEIENVTGGFSAVANPRYNPNNYSAVIPTIDKIEDPDNIGDMLRIDITGAGRHNIGAVSTNKLLVPRGMTAFTVKYYKGGGATTQHVMFSFVADDGTVYNIIDSGTIGDQTITTRINTNLKNKLAYLEIGASTGTASYGFYFYIYDMYFS